MIVAAFSVKPYDQQFLEAATAAANLPEPIEWRWFSEPLRAETARLAEGATAVCCFVNDTIDAACIETLAAVGVKLICLRCAGFNQVDLQATEAHGIPVVRVPEYSPHAVAEHTVGLVLMLNRRLHKAYNRVREGNFALDGLLGFDLHGRTAGVIGTGKIGRCVAEILLGFGCQVLAHDLRADNELVGRGVVYLPLDELLQQSRIVSLHCPLLPATYHLINAERINLMQPGAMLINTSRGGLVDTGAVIEGLKQGQIGSLGLDVYEEEADLFFDDKSGTVIQDDLFMRLLTFPNVVVTAHQAFFTREALEAIADHTVHNLRRFACGEPLEAVVAIG